MTPSDPQNDGIISGINVTPLVDIMLVLLVIFMVTAKVMITPAVTLDLPKAANTEDIQVVLSILISPGHPTFVDGNPVVSMAELTKRSMRSLEMHPNLRAVIQADGAVPHRDIIGVMDALKIAGVDRIAFAARPGSP